MDIVRGKTFIDPARATRALWLIVAVIVAWPVLVLAEFKPWVLFSSESLRPTLKFLADFVPPKVEPSFLQLVARETWRTVAVATAGVFLALVFSIPLALVCARNLSISAIGGEMNVIPRLTRRLVRWLLIFLRSVPELIWALVLVRVVGLGPTAGVLAIALTYTGMLGKVYSEILESGDGQSSQALLGNGAGRLQSLCYGLLPQNAAELTSYTVYRWECAIRSSVVLGFVGAGGLGQLLDSSMKMFSGSEVCTILLVFITLVWLADRLSSWLRRNLD